MTEETTATTTLLSDALLGLALDKDDYIDLLQKLIAESRHVQSNVRQGLIPDESKVARHILEFLDPYRQENGGPLIIQELIYQDGRPNLKIVYPGTDPEKCTGLIGSHMDVVSLALI